MITLDISEPKKTNKNAILTMKAPVSRKKSEVIFWCQKKPVSRIATTISISENTIVTKNCTISRLSGKCNHGSFRSSVVTINISPSINDPPTSTEFIEPSRITHPVIFSPCEQQLT